MVGAGVAALQGPHRGACVDHTQANSTLASGHHCRVPEGSSMCPGPGCAVCKGRIQTGQRLQELRHRHAVRAHVWDGCQEWREQWCWAARG